MAIFSEQLREIIRQSGRSGYSIAKATGIEQSQLSKFMNRKVGLQQSNIDILCEHLGGVRLTAIKPGKKQKPNRKPPVKRKRRTS